MPLLIGIAVILGLIISAMHPFKIVTATPVYPNAGLETRLITVGSSKLMVEVAATDAEQKQGLSDRSSLGREAGMLFPLIDPSQDGFWMKDMKFPLDFIYFEDGRVVETKENVQVTPIPIPFFPNEAVDAVLEVNAGFVKAHNIKVGDLSDY